MVFNLPQEWWWLGKYVKKINRSFELRTVYFLLLKTDKLF